MAAMKPQNVETSKRENVQTPKHENAESPGRYSRQILFQPIGEAGQAKIAAARVTLIGCGALGTVLADTLARAGIGFLRIVDRDFVEWNNLQRQVLFDEADAAEGLPKAVAAAAKLHRINSAMTTEPIVADAHGGNIQVFVDGADLILDGTDNFETRFLINDVSVKCRVPWVYGACVGSTGMVMPILPGRTPCLRCVWPEPPPPGMSPTCDTAGVLASVVHVVAGVQAAEALKILVGRWEPPSRKLTHFDVWTGRYEQFDLSGANEAGDCPCCGVGRFDYLTQQRGGRAAALCGRNAVQVSASPGEIVDLEATAQRLAPLAKSPPTINRYLLRVRIDRYEITLFRDGRAIVKGVSSPAEARTLYAKYVGA